MRGRKTGLLLSLLAFFGLTAAGPAAAQSSDPRAQLVAASTLTRATKAKELRVGWAPWFPFLYRDPKTEKMAGLTVEIYEQYMAKALGVKIVWVEQPWSTMMAGLQADQFDVISNANRTLPRLLVAEYAGPLTQTGKALLTTKAKVAQYADWHAADDPKTKICVALGSSADTEVTAAFPKAEVMRLDGDPACIAALGGQRADMYATDIGNLVALTKEHDEFVIVPKSTFTKTELGIFVKQGDEIMLNWLNQFIRDIKLQGVVDGLIKKYKVDGVEVAW